MANSAIQLTLQAKFQLIEADGHGRVGCRRLIFCAHRCSFIVAINCGRLRLCAKMAWADCESASFLADWQPVPRHVATAIRNICPPPLPVSEIIGWLPGVNGSGRKQSAADRIMHAFLVNIKENAYATLLQQRHSNCYNTPHNQ